MRPASHIAPEDTIDRAALELRRSGNGLVPVVAETRIVGVLTEAAIARALAEGVDVHEAAELLMESPPLIRSYMTGAEALRLIDEGFGPTLVVVDDHNNLMGLLSPSDIFPRRVVIPRPSLVGGMATPFGVYLTNGAVGAGVGSLALMATGFMMFALMALGQVISLPLVNWMASLHLPDWALSTVDAGLPVAFFLLFMRLAPLSGTHAAEHMVVHAIERGEELRADVVKRMPRVHPRCGTNIAVGLMVFVGILNIPVGSMELKLLPAVLITLYSWKKLGAIAQYYVTTKKPSKKQIESGLRAGNELLDKYSKSRVSVPSIPLRIWRSGLLQVMLGSICCAGILWAVDSIWNLNLGF